MKVIGQLKAILGLEKKGFDRGVDSVKKRTGSLKKFMKTAGTAIAGFFAFTAILQGLKKFIQINAQFGQSIADLSAITGATGRDLEFYRQQAKEIGSTTTLSASQAAKAFELMGSARPELLKSKEALAAVTKEAVILAEAAGLDLPTATQALAKTMNQFEIASEDAGKAINVLAAGSKMGAEAIPGIADAIKVMGTAANMAEISLEGTVGMIETLAEKGLSGAESGTQLRNVILKLQSEADRFNPKVVGLNKALENLGEANFSAAELTKMFGLESQQAAAILINNRDKLQDYTDAVTDTNVAYEQQAVKVDTLEGAWKGFKSAIEGVIIQQGDFNEALKEFVTAVTGGIRKLSEFKNEVQEYLKSIGAAKRTGQDFAETGHQVAGSLIETAKGMEDQGRATTYLSDEIKKHISELEDLQKHEKRNAGEIIKTKAVIMDLIEAKKNLITTEKEGKESKTEETEEVEKQKRTLNDIKAEIDDYQTAIKDADITDREYIQTLANKILELKKEALAVDQVVKSYQRKQMQSGPMAPAEGKADIPRMGISGEDINAMAGNIRKATEDTREFQYELTGIGSIANNVFSGMSNIISDSLNSTEGVFDGFVKSFANMIKGMVVKLIAATIAATALAAVLSALGVPVDWGGGAKAATGFMGNFKGALKSFTGFGVGSKATEMASGGVIPGGYPNDTFPALLSSGERVLTPQQNRSYENGGMKVSFDDIRIGHDAIYISAKKGENKVRNSY